MQRHTYYSPPQQPTTPRSRLPISGGSGGLYEAAMATALFISNYRKMRRADWIDGDKYYHCKANAQAAQLGRVGETTGKVISWGREIHDPIKNFLKGDDNDSAADQFANIYGRDLGRKYPHTDATKLCAPWRPEKMPQKYW